MTTTYRLVISGIKDGHPKDKVVKQLALLLEVPEENVLIGIASTTFVVKNGIHLHETEKYKAALEQQGCVCSVESETDQENTSPVLNAPKFTRQEPVEGVLLPCSQCGFKLPITAKFCRSCGANQSKKIGEQQSIASTTEINTPVTIKSYRSRKIAMGAAFGTTIFLSLAGYAMWASKQTTTTSPPQQFQRASFQKNIAPYSVEFAAKTIAGDLTIVKSEGEYSPRTTLNLGDQVVFEAGVQEIAAKRIFDFSERTVVLISTFDMGSSSSSTCNFISIQKDGKTATIGDAIECDNAQISVNQEEITVTVPYDANGDDVWKLSKNVLTHISKHDFEAADIARKNAENNADQLEIISGTPIKVRGTLMLDDPNGRPPRNYWILKFPRSTYISDKVSGEEFCNVGLRDSLPIDLGNTGNHPVSPPNIKGEAEFMVTIDTCPQVGPSITTISLAGTTIKNNPTNQPSLNRPQ